MTRLWISTLLLSLVADPASAPVPVTEFAPLVIDIAGNGITTVGAGAGVNFDYNADGHLDRLGWTRGGSDDASLTEDVTGDGRIETGIELLCGQTAGPNGFEALQRFDSDRNGRLDSSDPAFRSTLILWTDLDHNGVSERDELSTPAAAGVVKIDLGYREVQETAGTDANVVVLKGSATVRNRNGVPTATSVNAVMLEIAK